MTNLDHSERKRIEHKIRAKAHRRVRARLGFYWHFMVFVLASAAMVAINLTQSPSYMWFVWPIAAWSVGIIFHAFATFSGGGMTESMVEAEISREMSKRGLA